MYSWMLAINKPFILTKICSDFEFVKKSEGVKNFLTPSSSVL